ncbi:MAG: transporter substrate-binding domain-containing protein [Clostridiaceae bacterium]|nr:transporter substrate-binding domain-containing protein [Clostridiaceae bacterium]
MTKKFLALILSMLMVFSMLAACSSDDAQTNEGSDNKGSEVNQSTDTTKDDKQTESRTVVVGTTGSGEPYSLIDDKGNWTGAEADLWAEIEKRTGWTIEVKQVGDTASLFGELNTGRVDVAANCYAITATRLETYIASDPIYADAQVVIVKPDSGYKTLEDLRGKTIGVTAGQAAESTVEKLAPDYDWEVVTYQDSAAGFQDCSLGRVEAYANTVTNIQKAERAQGFDFYMLEEKLFGNNVGWWFADTEESTELRDELNKVLADMQKDGTVSKIVTNWFFEDLTKLISDEWLTATH